MPVISPTLPLHMQNLVRRLRDLGLSNYEIASTIGKARHWGFQDCLNGARSAIDPDTLRKYVGYVVGEPKDPEGSAPSPTEKGSQIPEVSAHLYRATFAHRPHAQGALRNAVPAFRFRREDGSVFHVRANVQDYPDGPATFYAQAASPKPLTYDFGWLDAGVFYLDAGDAQ